MRAAIKRSTIEKFFGKIKKGTWPLEPVWCSTIKIPSEIKWINSATGEVAGHIYCNRELGIALLPVLHEIVKEGLHGELKTFDGCLSIRKVRGNDEEQSIHSWGMAIDINAATNKLGTNGNMNQKIVEIFKRNGFYWGGDYSRKDPMHFTTVDESK